MTNQQLVEEYASENGHLRRHIRFLQARLEALEAAALEARLRGPKKFEAVEEAADAVADDEGDGEESV